MSLNHNIPVSFGVLTTDTIEQAIERAGSKAGNKGFEAMTTVIEMLIKQGALMATRHQVRQSVISLLYAFELNSQNNVFVDEILDEKKYAMNKKFYFKFI